MNRAIVFGLLLCGAMSHCQSGSSADLRSGTSLILQLEKSGVTRETIRGVFLAVFNKQIFDLKRGVKFKRVRIGVKGGEIPAEWRKALSKQIGLPVLGDSQSPEWGAEVVLRIGATKREQGGHYFVESARMWGTRAGAIEQFKVGKSRGSWVIWRSEVAGRF